MNRQHFSKPVQREIIKRASINGVPTCEWVDDSSGHGFVGGIRCTCTRGLQIHHDTKMDAMKSDEDKAKIKLTAEDGLLLCEPHHKPISKQQVGALAAAIRIEDKRLGVTDPHKAEVKRPPKKLKTTYKTDAIRALREAQFARQEAE